jgi:hypothetical protein
MTRAAQASSIENESDEQLLELTRYMSLNRHLTLTINQDMPTLFNYPEIHVSSNISDHILMYNYLEIHISPK